MLSAGLPGAPPMVTFQDRDGRRWCISHSPDQRPKQSATSEEGASTRRKLRKVMAPETPCPDWSTATAIRQWAQDRGGRVERGELDQRVIPQRLAELAMRSHEVQAQEN